MGSRCSVPTGLRIADVSIVENAFRQTMKDMTFVQDLRSTVWQEAAAFGFDGEHGKDFGSVRAQHGSGGG
jgi:hypothetical protein